MLGRSAPAGAAPCAPQEHPELTAARQQARDEARRLREAGRLADHERREWLADLASRLTALLRHLTSSGVPAAKFDVLRELVAAIEAGVTVNVLWDKALQVLDYFAAGNGASKNQRTFWKRS